MAEVGNGQSLRNSTGKLKATAKGVDDGPNYLRASSGSCHDACKYGTPHEFKAKPKRPVRRRSMPNTEIPIEIFVPSDKRSAKAVKPSSVAPDASVRSSSIGAPKSIRQQAPSSTKVRSSHVSKQIGQETRLNVKSLSPDVSDSVKQESSLDVKPLSPDLSNLAKQESSLDVNSLSLDSSKSVKQDSSSPDSSTSVKQESSSSQRQYKSSTASKSTLQDVGSRRKSSLSNVSGSSVLQSASKPVRSPHLMPGSISKASTFGRKSSSMDASKPVKREPFSSNGKAKLGGSMTSKSNRARTEQSSPPNSLGSKRNTGVKIDNDSRTSKAAASKKKMESPTTSLPLKTRKSSKIAATGNSLASSSVALTPNLPGTKVARLNVRNNITKKEATSSSKKPGNEKVPEKTLHMIEVESSNQQSPGSHLQLSPKSFDSLCQSKSPFSSQDAVETNSESEYTDSEADDTVSSSRRASGKCRVEGNESAAVKLKFRRGKVVDPQCESNSPRRLRFRRKGVSGNDESVGNEHRRSLKGRDTSGDADDTKAADGMAVVVLRHQDVQEKRSEQGLLNVVIEETASKLVETRKSKVKALVGAFETVISLQESKSSGDKPSPSSSPVR